MSFFNHHHIVCGLCSLTADDKYLCNFAFVTLGCIGAGAYEARRLVPPLIFVTQRHQRHAMTACVWICSWRSYFWLHFLNPDSGNAAKMHCFGHALNMSGRDAVRSIPLIRDVMQNLRDLSTIVHGSAKRLATFRAVADGVETCDAMTPPCHRVLRDGLLQIRSDRCCS